MTTQECLDYLTNRNKFFEIQFFYGRVVKWQGCVQVDENWSWKRAETLEQLLNLLVEETKI